MGLQHLGGLHSGLLPLKEVMQFNAMTYDTKEVHTARGAEFVEVDRGASRLLVGKRRA